MDLIKVVRTVIAGGIGLGLGVGAACVVQPTPAAPHQPGPPPATATQGGAQAAPGQLADGWYYCHFRQQNEDYKRYFCRVYRSGNAQHIHKAGGFERFAGTFTSTASGAQLQGRSACNRMGTNCRGNFRVSFAGAGSVFRGQVESPGWWLHNATLTLQYISPQAPRGAFGGAGYGGASYGGAGYGGATYGGASYGGRAYGGAVYGGHR